MNFARGIAVLALLSAALIASNADAACNLIPQSTRVFAGTLGSTNRPFAAPGELIEVEVRSCDAASPRFADTGPEHVVSVVIKPAAGGPGKLIPLSTNCGAVTVCPGSPACRTVTASDLVILTRNGSRQLRFPFPNTDVDLPPDGDGLPLVGPAAIAVTRVGEPLPCSLTTTTCASQIGLTACVDNLFFNDGACGQAFTNPIFSSFTALPQPNDYQNDCFDKTPPCLDAGTNLRLAVDAGGNLLLPMNWSGVVALNSAPVPRELTVNMQPPVPIAPIPSQAFLTSYTPEGALLPPFFEPKAVPSPAPNTLSLFGTADAPYSILRVARRRGKCASGPNLNAACSGPENCSGAPCTLVCVGGGSAGNTCTTDGDCLGGACGKLFDLAGAAGAGGIVLPRLGPGICEQAPHGDCSTNADCVPGDTTNPCVNFSFEAGAAHDLNGFVATGTSLGFVVSERVEGANLNGDGDPTVPTNQVTDDVVILRSRTNGAVQPIGNNIPCGINASPQPPGRAVVGLSEPPFQFHALAGEGDVVAFLESEADEKQCDMNGDGDAVDAILRAYRLGPTEITAGKTLTADAALRVNGRSLAVSNGRVFFRAPEHDAATRTTSWATVDSNGNPSNERSGWEGTGPRLSGDGRYLVFSSLATDLVTNPPPGGIRSVYRRDLVAGTTEEVDVDPNGDPYGFGGWVSISSDGNFVTFLSAFNGVLPPLPGGSNGFSQVYVRDMANGMTEYVTISPDGMNVGDNHAGDAAVSPGGQYVVFTSAATNLDPTCNNGHYHVFVRDRGNDTTTCVSVNANNVQADEDSQNPRISDDGRIVAFDSYATNLVAGDANTGTHSFSVDVFVYDRTTGELEIVDRRSNGAQLVGLLSRPMLSGDGRYVAFETNAVSPCTGAGCVLVKDRETGVLENIGVDSAGAPLGNEGLGDISADGRYVVFYSAATLSAADTNGAYDVMLRDRLAGTTEYVGLGDNGALGNSRGYNPYMSDDGRVIAFLAWSALDANDTLSICDTDQDPMDPTPADENCQDIYVSKVGPDEHCGNAMIDAGETCDPPGSPACGMGQTCSLTCHCGDRAADITGDGTLDQTVLEVLDARVGFNGAVRALCPADDVVAAGGTAAFLRPEAAGNADPMNCPNVGASLNAADNDLTDTVVQLSTLGGAAQNLGRAATALAMGAACSTSGIGCSADADCTGTGETCRPPYLAALVSEEQEGGVDRNGDSDPFDTVLNVYQLVGSPGWQTIMSQQAADAVDMKGNLAVFTTPEAAQNDTPLNGDGLADDRVLRFYDASTQALTDTHIAAQDFVLGDPALVDCGSGPELHQVIAFRTSEEEQGAGSLNAPADSDTTDSVLYVIDYRPLAHTWTLIDKKMAVTPCTLEACDPRFPYRVIGKSVRFLTREQEQGNQDLNGDRDTTDLILQTIDVCTGALTPISAVDETIDDGDNRTGNDPTKDPDGGGGNVTVSNGARCVQGMTVLLVPATCATNADCPAGSVCTSSPIVVATSVDDVDFDGVPDGVDNCVCPPNPDVSCANPFQEDYDGDGVGDACDEQISGCALFPFEGCRVPIAPLKSSLQIKNKADDKSDSVKWKFAKGESTLFGDLGNPLATHSYALCVYDESSGFPELMFEAAAPAGGTCGTSVCWKALGTTGYKYKDKLATPQGLTQIKIKAGVAGKTQAKVQGKGASLLLPPMPLPLPARVQLQASNGKCWETIFDTPGVLRNDTGQFKAKDP